MEPDLSKHFNYGLVPPPDFDWEPPRLNLPGWRPTPVQAQTARRQLAFSCAALALLALVFLALILRGGF